MANAKPATKVAPVTDDKPNEIVAFNCPVCKAKTWIECGKKPVCANGCKAPKKDA